MHRVDSFKLEHTLQLVPWTSVKFQNNESQRIDNFHTFYILVILQQSLEVYRLCKIQFHINLRAQGFLTTSGVKRNWVVYVHKSHTRTNRFIHKKWIGPALTWSELWSTKNSKCITIHCVVYFSSLLENHTPQSLASSQITIQEESPSSISRQNVIW
jgi:hypothetical protein